MGIYYGNICYGVTLVNEDDTVIRVLFNNCQKNIADYKKEVLNEYQKMKDTGRQFFTSILVDTSTTYDYPIKASKSWQPLALEEATKFFSNIDTICCQHYVQN